MKTALSKTTLFRCALMPPLVLVVLSFNRRSGANARSFFYLQSPRHKGHDVDCESDLPHMGYRILMACIPGKLDT